MPKYVIERELPGAGKMTREQLREVAQKSNGVLQTLGPKSSGSRPSCRTTSFTACITRRRRS